MSTKEQQQSIRAAVKVQLRAINPVIQQPTNRAQRKAIRRNPELLKPVWYREITNRLLEAVLPHCRRGTEDFRKGRDQGYFLGGLLRDQEAVKAAKMPLRKKGAILRQLKDEIEACESEAGLCKGGLPIKKLRDFDGGYIRGMEFAKLQPALFNMHNHDQPTEILNPSSPDYSAELLIFLWHRMPYILTHFKSLVDLYECIFQKSAGEYPKWTPNFRAFQKQCQRIGLKLRLSGRPRQV